MALVSVKNCTHLTLGLLAGITAVPLVLIQPTLAQFTNSQPLQDWDNQESRDPFSGKTDGGGASFSVMEMIHRANLGSSRTLGEFAEEQNENLDDAAAQFRRQQRERLQIPTQIVPVEPQNTVTTP